MCGGRGCGGRAREGRQVAFGPNASWHSLAARVSAESGKGRQQRERVRDGEREEVLK